MGSFNWFNRQYNDSPATEQETSETAEANQSAPVETEVSPDRDTSGQATNVNEDYLSWAKAAYANIRKRQEGEAPDSTPSSEPTSSEAENEASPPPTVESLEITQVEQSETPETPETPAEEVLESGSEPPGSEPTVSPVSLSESTPSAELSPAATATAPDSETEPQATAPLPFWAQAEAERLERLERLKAEAQKEAEAQTIEAPAILPSPSPEDAIASIPDFVLDEAFLWSAEVLAAQGRRPDQVSIEEITWLNRLRQGLDKTRRSLVNQLRSIVGQGPLNQDAVTEIESLLLQADVGIEATDYIIESLQNTLRQEALPPQEAIAYLKQLLRGMLDRPLGDSHSLSFVPEKDKLNIWLITGVNGAGKTTTIGKLAHIAQKSGYRCLIAAADTFRAAAVQQVKVWGERSDVEVIANPGKNTDPAAVVFDAIAAAQSRNTELLLVDTAGRLQNKKNLMDELSKIRRIIDKKAPNARVESLLVLDSTLGQNGLRQAEVFSEVAKLSGVVLTKLDGTAKGGIALAVVQQLDLPIRFIGAGEGIEDLRPFSSYEFVEALLSG